MQGVEFLSSKEVLVKEKFNWKWFFIMFSLIIIVDFVLVQFSTFTEVSTEMSSFTNISAIIFGFIWGIISGVFIGNLNAIPVQYVTEYKVALLDETAFKELEEKYEIINKDGKLLTIREII